MTLRLVFTTGLAVLVLWSVTACEPDHAAANSSTDSDRQAVTLTFAFQPQENPDGLQLDTERFAEFIADRTGTEVEVFLPTNYASVVEALRGGNADIAYFSGLPYLRSHEMADVELLVVEERDGHPYYYSQWYALADSDIDTLSDLRGKSVAFTSPTSTSGFLFPLAEVIDQGLLEQGGDPNSFFGHIVYAGGYQQALLSLVNGRVGAAAASDYALQTYLSAEQRDQIKVIATQGPVPTHGLAIRSDLSPEIKEAVRAALLELNDEAHVDLLRSVYGAEKLVVREHDDHVSALQRAYDLVDLDNTL